jgi:sphingolipid 4-desaturase/C4-monooxygenase
MINSLDVRSSLVLSDETLARPVADDTGLTEQPAQSDFLPAHKDRPHPQRRRAITAAHPEVKKLLAPDPVTAVIILGAVLFQTAMAALFGHLGFGYWWLALIAAYGIGAFANHAMFVAIHDATHGAIFDSPRLNKLAAILADLPNGFPTAMGFRCYHMKHHSHLGDYDYDADLPSHWEAHLVGNRWYAKALWLFFFPIMQLGRLSRLKGTVPMLGRWTYINAVAIIIYDLAVIYFLGLAGFVYLFASFWFSVGLHPLGARWVQEHFTFDPDQETNGYYGPLNIIALNIGYHNEHHDFPEMPWTRLPKLKKMAPEFYDHLATHPSWTGLFFEFIFDSRYTLYSRVNRSEAALAARGIS